MHAWRIVLFHPLLCATYVLCDQFCFQAHLTAVRCSPPQHHCPARDVWRAKFGRTCTVQVLVDDVLCRVGAGWWSGVSAQLSV